MASAIPSPLAGARRQPRLDQLRGLAVLGILPVNLVLFSGPFASLANPLVWGQLKGPNAWAWWLTHLFFEQKFLTLFCMIFGGGLVIQRQRWGNGPQASSVHRRRMMVLFALGMLHAYGIWYGDILAPYAVCGLLLWPATAWPARKLCALGLLVLTVPPLVGWMSWLSLPGWSAQAIESLERAWAPSLARLLTEIADYRGDWSSQMHMRVPQALFMQLQLFPVSSAWRLLGSMLLGMAAMRSGLIIGQEAAKPVWRAWAWVLAVLGLAFTAWGGQQLLAADPGTGSGSEFGLARAALLSGQPLYWGSLAMAWSYLLLFPQGGLGGRLGSGLADLGRMALTNYLLQSLLCMGLFYGTGMALFGQVQRWQLLVLSLGVALLQFFLSRAWLDRFERGPVEWLWRRASYRA